MTAQCRALGKDGRDTGDTAGEEVPRDVRLFPDRTLEDGSAVVRREIGLGHHPALAHAGPRHDPFVRRVEERRQIGVGQDRRRQPLAPARYRGI